MDDDSCEQRNIVRFSFSIFTYIYFVRAHIMTDESVVEEYWIKPSKSHYVCAFQCVWSFIDKTCIYVSSTLQKATSWHGKVDRCEFF